MSAKLEAECAALREQKDGAYLERARVLAVMTRMAQALGLRCGLARHPDSDESWEHAWRTIVFVDLPTGQCSWHLHDHQVPLYAHLPTYTEAWDGHSTAEKYLRCEAFCASTAPPASEGRVYPLEAERDALRAENERLRARVTALATRKLAQRMSDISAECWCAQWHSGTEDTLWTFLTHGPGPWGMDEVTAEDIAELRALSEEAGGWYVWDDDAGDARFVPRAEWLARVDARKGAT